MGQFQVKCFLTADFDVGVVSNSLGSIIGSVCIKKIFIDCLFKTSNRSETRCRALKNSRKSIGFNEHDYNDSKKIPLER